MRCLQGVAHNIPHSVIGKLVSETTPTGVAANAFLCLTDYPLEGAASGCILIGSTSEPPPNSPSNPQFILQESTDSLSHGDVVIVEPEGLLTVLFERKSFHNALLLTERCNSKCIMCPQPPQADREDGVSLCLRIIDLLDPDIDSIAITGGEPTVVWEGLKKVLSACQSKLPNTSIQLLTNGRALKDFDKVYDLVGSLKIDLLLCIPVYADIDTLHDQIVSAKGAFWETLEGIHNCARLGLPVEIRTVVMKMNFERLPQWAEFVYRTFPFAVHVAIMGLEPIGLASENISNVWVDPVEYAGQLREATRVLHRRNISVSLYNHQLCVIPPELWQYSRKSISDWKRVYLPECESCRVHSICGGFFSSAYEYRSKGISPVI
jgi:His-Xaa-Ser system radical SAM maturase HxsC